MHRIHAYALILLPFDFLSYETSVLRIGGDEADEIHWVHLVEEPECQINVWTSLSSFGKPLKKS